MSIVRVRRLDENWDPCYGNGVNDYITDIDAVCQIIETRLRLWLGEWWEDQSEGLPMYQKILGKLGTNKVVVDRLLQKRVLSSPYVRRILGFTSTFDVATREYQCKIYVDTDFGTIVVSNGV